MTSLIDAALACVAKGIPIFPVGAGKEGKHRSPKTDFMTQAGTQEKIRAWWTKYPRAKIGMPCGCERDHRRRHRLPPRQAKRVQYSPENEILAGSPGYEIERGDLNVENLKPVPAFLLANGKVSRGGARLKSGKKTFNNEPTPDWLIERCKRENLSLQPEIAAEAEPGSPSLNAHTKSCLTTTYLGTSGESGERRSTTRPAAQKRGARYSRSGRPRARSTTATPPWSGGGTGIGVRTPTSTPRASSTGRGRRR